MMRIAIAGGGGFANILARQLAESAHAIIILSTQAGRPIPMPFYSI
jgi:Trk K+ transport system NAD-binding subunit